MKQRNLPIEILRIFSMFLIILFHSIEKSTLLESVEAGTTLYYIEQYFLFLVQVCVNCFVLISGYFLINSKFKFKKLIYLWIEVVFYSFSIKLMMMLLGKIPVSALSLVSCLFPILTGRYWFVPIYFGLYLISPFLNKGLSALTKNQHYTLGILLIILFSVMVSIHPSINGMNSGAGWGLPWFIVLYIIAAYLQKHYKHKVSHLIHFGIFFTIPLFIVLGLILCQKLPHVFTVIIYNFKRYDSITSLISSISLMKAFIIISNKNKSSNNRLKFKYSPKVIQVISSSTFGIYLIHMHTNISTPDFWNKLGIPYFHSFWWFPIYQVVICIAIFFVCSFIEILRQRVFILLRINKIIDISYTRIKNMLESNAKIKQLLDYSD